MISAMVSAGFDAGYVANPRLAKVHWQADDRELPAPQVSVAGESMLWVDPAEVRPTTTSPGSAGRSVPGGTASETNSWPTLPPTAGCAGAS
jgi:hypothetical protein